MCKIGCIGRYGHDLIIYHGRIYTNGRFPRISHRIKFEEGTYPFFFIKTSVTRDDVTGELAGAEKTFGNLNCGVISV